MRHRTERRAGFALIEVLAALVITAAFVAVVLPFAVHLLARWQTGEPEIENADAWMQAIERLSDDIAEAAPLMVTENGRRAIGFRAGPGFVKFVRPALGQGAKVSLEVVTYSIESRAAGDMLVRHARPYGAGAFADEQAAASESTLLDGPFRFKFSILGPAGRPEDGWHDPKHMPLSVELSVHGLARARVPPGPIVLPIVAQGKKASSVQKNEPPQKEP